jgi:prolyl oligopeptidase
MFFLPMIIFGITYGYDKKLNYPPTDKIKVVDTLHGTEIIDYYQWLENANDPKVQKWTEAQERLTRSVLDSLPQRSWVIERLNQLWRYDDESIPHKVIEGERIFLWTKKKEGEKWIYNVKENEDAPIIELLNPNNWDPTETLSGVKPSRDGKYVAFGKAIGGNENPIVKIMEVATKKILPDTLRGWQQYVLSWLPNNLGFYYSAKPLKGEVPEGEEHYWSAVYFHKLGTPGEQDKKIFYHDKIKEYYHSAYVTEDGKYVIFYRSRFNKTEVYYKEVGNNKPIKPLVTDFDAIYRVTLIENKFFITTDLDAPMYKVYVTDVDKPGKENWREFIPENKKDKLSYIVGIAGHIYAVYQHNAYTKVKIYDIEGKYIKDLPLPTLGTCRVSGYWSKPDIWVWFSSFTYPSTIFKYDFEKDSLMLYKKFPLDIDVENYTTEQVWYNSKDGTSISMFLIHRKDLEKNGKNPTLLTGYGGFNISITPYFSTTYVIWLERGGIVAIPNLRGGGEYGKEWHEAGMKEKKQNVFDDFICAAEWLIENKYTNPQKLAISGKSNGGLLVGAVTIQRPDLFRVVVCSMPLLDMIRYHKFGYANIWTTEYGSSEDSVQFQYLYKYSPYHNVIDGTKYPAILIIGSENDARTYPLHARKMIARLQDANPNGEPHLLLIRKASGHGGGTTLSVQIEQTADRLAFLMHKLKM